MAKEKDKKKDTKAMARATRNVQHNGVLYNNGDLIKDAKAASELIKLDYAKKASLKKTDEDGEE